jgi:peptide methionine sulfoxide reductase msrA/msrB
MSPLRPSTRALLPLVVLSLLALAGCKAASCEATPGVGEGGGGGTAEKQASAAPFKESAMSDYKKPTEEDLRRKLTPLQFEVTQKEATEPSFRNEYWDNHAPGIYVDVVSGEPLFSSVDKFESGTGWPSFTKPLAPENISTGTDNKLFMTRTEVRSKHGGSHLGHLFDDGPQPTGMRYCMNSAALRFIPVDKLEEEGYGQYLPLFGRPAPTGSSEKAPPSGAPGKPASAAPAGKAAASAASTVTAGDRAGAAAASQKSGKDSGKRETAILAGGCFWGMEEILRGIPGVIDTEVGYTGGATRKPVYEQVHAGTTGHAEAVRIVFDPDRLSFEDLLGWFFRMHDPTTMNRQGNDIGTSYRSAIFYTSDEQRKTAEAVKERVNASGKWPRPIVTEITKASDFWPAEDYHQDYLEKNPGGYTCHFLRD